MCHKMRRLQITQNINKNYKLIIFIFISNTVKNGLVLINNSHWGELRPGCNANRLEKFMLFFSDTAVLCGFAALLRLVLRNLPSAICLASVQPYISVYISYLGVSGGILRVINSYDNQ